MRAPGEIPQSVVAGVDVIAHLMDMPVSPAYRPDPHVQDLGPVFFDPVHGLTAAEMEPGLKNRISHRAQALAKLRELLRA